MDQGRNRVFINPNFNKSAVPIRQVSVMHINPSFCQHAQTAPMAPKAKIFINPNFVRPNVNKNQVPYVDPHYSIQRQSSYKNSTSTVSAPITKKHGSGITVTVKPASIQPVQTASRYSLVRQRTELSQPISTNTQSRTVKISKYKSIKVTDMKKTLDTVKLLNTGPSSSYKVTNHNPMVQKLAIVDNTNSKSPKTHVNRYKLVRPALGVVNQTQFKRQLSNNSRKIVCSRKRIKTIGVYKKNNIPCPQYRKYGKCLRKLHGKCEFLHDQKHVSICRKFLNGVCHDSKCLLSHELSDKKMPTCYFYLKGMCTKEECPYLHVKLNEKAKVCSDFVRGYCEKGDKCLNRHITKSLNVVYKRRHSIRQESPQKSKKNKDEKNRTKSNLYNTQTRSSISITQMHHQKSQEKKEPGGRYYKESVQKASDSTSLEVIKPSRCKLGVLPSFIQL